MRKLWPSTFDNLSIRIWALALAILISLLGLGWTLHGGLTDIIWWFGCPGVFVFAPIAGGGIEEVNGWRAWCGFAGWLLSNAFFYYFIARFLLRLFQPVKSWWPEERM